MKTTVESLKDLYVKLGGSTDDVYPEIADGVPVGDYTIIPDCVGAIANMVDSSDEDLIVTHDGNGHVTISVR